MGRLLAALFVLLVVVCAAVIGAALCRGAPRGVADAEAAGGGAPGAAEAAGGGAQKRVRFNPVVQVREIERIGTRKIVGPNKSRSS